MKNFTTNEIIFEGKESDLVAIERRYSRDDGKGIDFNKVIPVPVDFLLSGKRKNEEWKDENWGTEENASGSNGFEPWDDGKIYIHFDTVGAPYPVIQKISETFPDVEIQMAAISDDGEDESTWIGGVLDYYDFQSADGSETIKC